MKRLIILSVLFILAISLTSAKPILSMQDNWQPGETILGQISLDTPTETFEKKLSQEDLQVYQGNKQINFESDITLYNNVFYFYILPTYQGNFTLKIPNILYKETALKSETLEKQIQIATINSSQLLSIKPGFVISSSKAELVLENKGTENLSINYDNNNLVISPGAVKKVYLEPIKQGNFFWISFKTYQTFNVPFIFISLTEQQIKDFLQPTKENVSIDIQAAKINQTCKDLQGEVCSPLEECQGTPKYTGELCCLGKCKSNAPSSNTWIYGLLIILGLGILAFIVFYKFHITKPKTSQEVLKESAKRYEKKQKLR